MKPWENKEWSCQNKESPDPGIKNAIPDSKVRGVFHMDPYGSGAFRHFQLAAADRDHILRGAILVDAEVRGQEVVAHLLGGQSTVSHVLQEGQYRGQSTAASVYCICICIYVYVYMYMYMYITLFF